MTALVQPFISTVPGSLDGKGRVCIPATYRHLLSAQNTRASTSAPASSIPRSKPSARRCWTASTRGWPGRIRSSPPAIDDEATALIARTQLLPIDENGRIRIPDAMIAHAGLKDRIVFVGKAQKFQIWDAERYAPVEAEALARVKARMERARGRGA